MKIACLGWGSLLWKAGALRLASEWQADGPWLPLEFARVGDGGELATVLTPHATLQRAWWARLEARDLSTACGELEERERIDPSRTDGVGSLPSALNHAFADRIDPWMREKGLDAVVWTALPPRFDDVEGRAPTIDEAVAYLESLRGEVRAHAEHYVRSVPSHLATPVRGAIEARLGWSANRPAAQDRAA